MKQIRDKVAGLDVHRDTVVACCRVQRPNRSIDVTKKSFATTSRGLVELAEWMAEAAVTMVVMEATGVYWKPVYYSLEGLFDELCLCNAQHVKNVRGEEDRPHRRGVAGRCCSPRHGAPESRSASRHP